MLTKKEILKATEAKKPQAKPPKFSGKGTPARLNTAAEKHLFKSNYSKQKGKYMDEIDETSPASEAAEPTEELKVE